MKIMNGRLWQAMSIIEGLNRVKLPSNCFKISYAVMRNIDALVPFTKVYDEALNIISDKWVMKKEGKAIIKDGQYQFENDEKRNSFIKERQETLDNIETEFEPYKIKKSEFEKLPDTFALSGTSLGIIKDFIEDDVK